MTKQSIILENIHCFGQIETIPLISAKHCKYSKLKNSNKIWENYHEWCIAPLSQGRIRSCLPRLGTKGRLHQIRSDSVPRCVERGDRTLKFYYYRK